MTHSSAIETAINFNDLALAPELVQAVTSMGYTTPTPIQKQAIPLVLAGRDLMAQAQTGTGKTAAFTLPLLHQIKPHANTSTSPARHPVRALVLAPTRELAIQVHESVVDYSKNLALRSTCVYGGVGMHEQEALLRSGVEVLVATPGRLLDHAGNKTTLLNQVQFLVLDEADRMLDMGFLPDLKRILDLLPAKRQTLLFSATFNEEITRLGNSFLRDPLKVEVARKNTAAETVEQVAHKVAEDDKTDALLRIVRARDLSQALVFTRTKISADKLCRRLQRRGVEAAVIHGDKAQVDRLLALEGFKQGKIKLLVATDIAARGIDIAELPCVVNYELPYHPEDYVHRIGRTGRAGASGLAVSLVSSEEDKLLAGVERFVGKKLIITDLPVPARVAAPVSAPVRAASAPGMNSTPDMASGSPRPAGPSAITTPWRRSANRVVCALLLPPAEAAEETASESAGQ